MEGTGEINQTEIPEGTETTETQAEQTGDTTTVCTLLCLVIVKLTLYVQKLIQCHKHSKTIDITQLL